MRFYVHKLDEKTIKIHGPIGDSVDLSPLNDLMAGVHDIDCSAIAQVSWTGLNTFNSYLVDQGKDIALISVPFHVFRYLRLIPGVGKHYEIKSYEVPVFQLEDSDNSLEIRQVESQELLSNIEQGLYDGLSEDSLKIEGNLVFWTPHHFPPVEVDLTSKFANPWAIENSSEFLFWRNLVAFSGITIGLASNLLSSNKQSINKLLTDITVRVDLVEAGTARLLDKPKMGLTAYLSEISFLLDHEYESLIESISQMQAGCDLVIRRMQVFAADIDGSSLPFYYENIKYFAEILVYLKEITGKVESAGETIGGMVTDIFIVPQLKAALADIESDDVSPELLEEARGDFYIMDPLSDGSWVDTRTEVYNEIEMVQNDIDNCTFLLQGVDLARQVLEHRISEGLTLLESIGPIQDGQKMWYEIRDQIIERIKKARVTAQEKFSFMFFFAEIEQKEETPESADPGEVILF